MEIRSRAEDVVIALADEMDIRKPLTAVSLIRRAIDEAVKAEREACAKVAEDIELEESVAFVMGDNSFSASKSISNAIRARGGE